MPRKSLKFLEYYAKFLKHKYELSEEEAKIIVSPKRKKNYTPK